VPIFLGLLYALGPSATLRALGGVRARDVGATAALFVLASAVRIYKWSLLRTRAGVAITRGELTGVYFSSKFWGMISPMRSGEVAPVFLDERVAQQRAGVTAVILYDRVLETFQTVMVFFALFFAYYGVFFDLRTGYVLAGLAGALALAAALLYSPGLGERAFRVLEGGLARLGPRGRWPALAGAIDRGRGAMRDFYASTRECFTVGFSLGCLAITFLGWGFDILFFVVLFKALGIGTGLLTTVAAVVVYSMAAALAPVPNGLGVADLGLALILGRLGYSGEVGGLIVISRFLVLAYVFAGYLFFNPLRARAGG
jgi:uncharacterized protein (TIRG00374 family)